MNYRAPNCEEISAPGATVTFSFRFAFLFISFRDKQLIYHPRYIRVPLQITRPNLTIYFKDKDNGKFLDDPGYFWRPGW